MRSLPTALLLLLLSSCSREAAQNETTLVFVHQPLGGDPRAFDELLDEFRKARPEISLRTQLLPNNSDVAHQYFVTALEGGTKDFDVLVTDVVWTPEFARAGWIANLSSRFPPEQLKAEFLPGPVEAVTLEGKTFAVPWYVDVGLLFYRKDLVPKAPETYSELEAFALDAQKKDPSLRGYVWQGRQYEGLVCNVYEFVWGEGGEALSGERLRLDAPETTAALEQLRRFVDTGVSPRSVLSAAEEESRQPFQSGHAVFMRNWPYAWLEANAPTSPIRDKVAFAPLPTKSGEPGNGTLGGWQLALNANSTGARRDAALALIEHLTSEKAQLAFALAYGRNPSRSSVYDSAELREKAPFIASLREHFARAKPRPVTPYYGLLSDTLQSEFSAAISGVRSPGDAMKRAQKQADRVTGAAP